MSVLRRCYVVTAPGLARVALAALAQGGSVAVEPPAQRPYEEACIDQNLGNIDQNYKGSKLMSGK